MTKQNIIDIVSNATGLTKVETEAVMNGVMKTIIDSEVLVLLVLNIVCLKKLGTPAQVMQFISRKDLYQLSNQVK